MASSKLKFKLSFNQGTFSGEDIFQKILLALWFNPEKIYISKKTKGERKFKEEYFVTLKNLTSDLSFVMSDQNNRISVTDLAIQNTFQSLDFEFSIENFEKVFYIVKSIIADENFITAYCCSEEDLFYQTTKEPSHYEVRGIPLNNSAVLFKDDLGWDTIDTSKNPGRLDLLSDFWFTSCWRMWFGNRFYEYFPKEKLQSFKKANKIEILENQITFIELYSNPFEAAKKLNRELQSSFREFIEAEL